MNSSSRHSAGGFATLLLILLGTSCSGPGPREPVVAASIPPLAALAEFVVGGRHPVVSMLPSGRSPHDYEPTPAEVDRARGALVFVYAHEQVDGWMVRSARAVIGPEAPLVGMSQTPQARGRDPHLWLDLDIVRDFVPRLARVLATADPDGAAGYEGRAAAFLDSLDTFDREAGALLAPVAGVPFAILHPAFETFIVRYGLNCVAVLERHPEGEALPNTLGEAMRSLRTSGARVVFAEPQLPPRVAEALAADLGAEVAFLDPLGGDHSQVPAGYLELLRYNVRQLRVNLR